MKTLLVKKEWDIKNGFKDEKGKPIGDYFSFYKIGGKADGKMVGVYYPAYWESDAASVAEWRAKDPENRKTHLSFHKMIKQPKWSQCPLT